MAEVPFYAQMNSTTLGEVWTHFGDSEQKFHEFGWRTKTRETGYGVKTLLGNWYEERQDVKELKKGRAIPSDYNHYFETTQKQSYNVPDPSPHMKLLHPKEGALPVPLKARTGELYDPEPNAMPQCSQNIPRERLRCFPGHQPQLDPREAQAEYTDGGHRTEYRLEFLNPKTRGIPKSN